jgi:CO dehydrogenase maturation factor
MDKLADTYPYTVMDNEAGLEHLSRRTTQDTDLLLIISDSSVRGIMTAGRIGELVKELNLNVKRVVLIVNRVQDGTSGDKALLQAIALQGVEFAGFVPADELIFEYDLNGKPLVQLPAGSKALTSFYSVLDRLIP